MERMGNGKVERRVHREEGGVLERERVEVGRETGEEQEGRWGWEVKQLPERAERQRRQA